MNDKLYYFIIDPNKRGSNITYNDVKELYNIKGIEFKNQSFPTLVNRIKYCIIMMQTNVLILTKNLEMIIYIFRQSKNKCNICEEKINK